MKYHPIFGIADPYKVLSHCLVEPRQEYLVRDIDDAFVECLKKELCERPSVFCKPLIAVVKNVFSKENFDEQKLDGLTLEVIGGNHRREAVCQLVKEGKLKDHPLMQAMVLLYTGKFGI